VTHTFTIEEAKTNLSRLIALARLRAAVQSLG